MGGITGLFGYLGAREQGRAAKDAAKIQAGANAYTADTQRFTAQAGAEEAKARVEITAKEAEIRASLGLFDVEVRKYIADMEQMIRKANVQLEALKAAADANGTDEEQALFADLLSKTFYTAVYFAADTNQPIAYLTDVAASAQNADNAVYFVYWEGNWYLRNPNMLDKKAMSEFDGLSAARIVNYLNAGVGFILAERVKLPLPTV